MAGWLRHWWLIFCWSTLAAAPPALPDQHGHQAGLDDFAGEAVLLIVVTARKAKHLGRWEEALRKDYPELRSLRVADVVGDPKPDYADVAKKLRAKAPEDVSILIDTDNAWAQAYELDTEEPCLVLLDAEHAEVARFRGRAKRDRVDEVKAALANYFPTVDAAT